MKDGNSRSASMPMLSTSYISLFRFEDAPEELQSLSTNGGDEDWIFCVPKTMREQHPFDLFDDGSYWAHWGWCKKHVYGKWLIYIFSHA